MSASFRRAFLSALLSSLLLWACACSSPDSPHDHPASAPNNVSSVAAQPDKNTSQSASGPTALPPLPSIQAPAAPPLKIDIITSPLSRSPALNLPTDDALAGARFDIWEAVRGGEQREKITIIMRPGNVRADSTDEGRTWRVSKMEFSVNHILSGVKMWWATGKLDERQRATRILESSDGGRTLRIKATDNNLSPEPKRLAKFERNLVLATGNDLLWSKDLGSKWQFISPQINQTISVLANHEGTWWLGGEGGAIAYATNPKRWKHEQLPDAVAIRDLAFSPSGSIFAASDSGLWVRELSDPDQDSPDAKDAKQPPTNTPASWRSIPISAQRRLLGVLSLENGHTIAFGEHARLLIGLPDNTLWTDATEPLRQALKLSPSASITWRKALETSDGGVLLFGDDATIVHLSLPPAK